MSDYENNVHDPVARSYAAFPVDAVQVDTGNADPVVEWLKAQGHSAWNRDGSVSIGHTVADIGEWIVIAKRGRLMVMDDELFRETYDSKPLD